MFSDNPLDGNARWAVGAVYPLKRLHRAGALRLAAAVLHTTRKGIGDDEVAETWLKAHGIVKAGAMNAILRRMDDRHACVLVLVYGLGDGEPRSNRQVAVVLGITTTTVVQRRHEGLRRFGVLASGYAARRQFRALTSARRRQQVSIAALLMEGLPVGALNPLSRNPPAVTVLADLTRRRPLRPGDVRGLGTGHIESVAAALQRMGLKFNPDGAGWKSAA